MDTAIHIFMASGYSLWPCRPLNNNLLPHPLGDRTASAAGCCHLLIKAGCPDIRRKKRCGRAAPGKILSLHRSL